jgi:Holliday junction DNA helicase RuvA
LTPARLAQAVAAGDLATLQKVPGIGRKGASRLILELAGKLAVDDAGPRPGRPAHPVRSEVLVALQGMGWNAAQAEAALDEVGDADESASTSDVLRGALRVLGARRG